jgi:hypothetical protein
MGRNTESDKTPILNDAEENIGSSAVIQPQAGTEGVVIPQSNPPRIIKLQGGSGAGQNTTVVMTASRIIEGAQNPYPGFPGPITGVIEFGNGGRFTKVEFDVPLGPFTGALNEASTAIEPADGMVSVTLPTSAIRAYARYDNLLLAPVLGWNTSHAVLSNPPPPAPPTIPIIGPGGPVDVATNAGPPAPSFETVPPEPVLVKAMAAYFSKPRAKVYKTLNCYVSQEYNPSAITVGTGFGGLDLSPKGGFQFFAFWALPAFTKSITILKFPVGGVGYDYMLHDGIRPVQYGTVAPGVSAFTVDVVGAESIVGIKSGAGVTMLKIVCEIGI